MLTRAMGCADAEEMVEEEAGFDESPWTPTVIVCAVALGFVAALDSYWGSTYSALVQTTVNLGPSLAGREYCPSPLLMYTFSMQHQVIGCAS
jgi:hypothetical protein